MRPEGTLQPRQRWGVVPPRVIRKVPVNGRESVNEHGLRAIGRRAFVRAARGDHRSPIVLRLTERLLLARDWASVRKSSDVDAYVLAWIASHVRGARRPRRMFM